MVRGTVGTCLGYHDHQLRVPGAGSVKVASTLLNAEILNGKHTVDTQDTPVTQRPRVRTYCVLVHEVTVENEDRQLSFPRAGP